VQIREPTQETNDSGSGVAEIRARVRIEEAGDALVPILQDSKIRSVRLLRFPKAKDLVSGVGPNYTLLNFRRAHLRPACRGYHSGGARCDPANLAAVYNRAAGEADRRDIKAHSNSHPQMDLEQDLAKQQVLRVVDPFLPDRPVCAVIKKFW